MSSKTIVIHQPDFVPYLGFFHRLLHADAFIILDHVRMSKRGWVHRDKIKTPGGEQWVSVPVRGLADSPVINEAEIDRNALYEKLPRMIEASYRKTAYFNDIFPHLLAPFEAHTKLIDLNMDLIKKLMEWLDIQIPLTYSSTLGVHSTKSAMNAELVHTLGGTHYLSGVGARDYHEQEPFEKLGIQVVWQDFTHPVYPQAFGEFIPFLSTLDALFNVGIEGTRTLLRSLP